MRGSSTSASSEVSNDSGEREREQRAGSRKAEATLAVTRFLDHTRIRIFGSPRLLNNRGRRTLNHHGLRYYD